MYALGFYLCATRPKWHEYVKDLRRNIMDEVDRMLKDPAGTFDTHRSAAIVKDDYTEKQDESWADYAATQNIDVNDALLKYVFVNRKSYVDLGDLEIIAFARRYDIKVCVWQRKNDEGGDVLRCMLIVPEDTQKIALQRGGVIPDYGTCVHLRYYHYKKNSKRQEGGHYTLLALLDSGATGFGRRWYV